ncbi:peptidoglycan binding domain-containing protein [Kitasatospora cinereorecta]
MPAGFGADPFAPGGAAQGAPEPEADEVPKTETTLTTRIRINIPGSRPIPPVVVRSPVKNEKAPEEPAGPRHRGGGSGDPVRGVMEDSARTATPPNLPPEWQEPAPASESDATGEWFKPRQKSRNDSEPASVPAGAPAGERPAAAEPRRGAAPRPSGTPASPFAPQPGAEAPAARQGQGQGTGPAGRRGQDPYGASPYRAEDPFAGRPAGGPQGPVDPFAAGPQADPFGAAPQADPFATGRPGSRPAAGQAGRPAPGADPFGARRPGGPQGAPRPPLDEEPEDTQIGGFDPIEDDRPQGGIPGAPGAPLFASAPPATGGPRGSRAPADPHPTGRPGTDAAGRPIAGADPYPGEHTGPEDPFATTRPGVGRFADSPGPARPFPGSPRANTPNNQPPAGPDGAQGAQGAEPEQEAPAAAAPTAPAAKKRSGRGGKLAGYAVGGLLFAGAAAYGTGLMLNQADIPKGTTVLGTDIGGDTRDQAVTALDGTVGKAGQQPLKLKIGDKAVQLDPATAGLSFDTTATVDGLTKHSYNPVEVIGSLTGGGKAVAPEVRVDKAKLKAALDDLAAKSGSGLQEGFVRFTDAGQAEVVPGKAGQGLDSASAADQVEQAYRNRAAGQADGEIALGLAPAQPKVAQDALQAAADSLGKQVLAGNVTVMAGTHKWDFGKNTAAKALTLAPDASGKIVPKWDLDKLDAAMGTSFDKVKFKKNGQLVPITAQDVADGLTQTFDKTGKDRVFKFAS